MAKPSVFIPDNTLLQVFFKHAASKTIQSDPNLEILVCLNEKM